MTTRSLGTVLRARPALLRWQDSPVTRAAIAIRWLAWLADGWRRTSTATIILVLLIGWAAPWPLGLAIAAGVWASVSQRAKTSAAIGSAILLAISAWWTWTHTGTLTQLALVGLAGVWPIDALAGLYRQETRLHRWWCELRRGFPIRYAIMAAKAQQIQGVIGGERQLAEGRRPILDHPAIARRTTVDGNTVWAMCSVPPGRNAFAFQDVLEELAASYVHVQRMDLVFVDDYQTYGYLAVTFGPPLLDTNTAPHLSQHRFTEAVYLAIPHLGAALSVVLAVWIGLT